MSQLRRELLEMGRAIPGAPASGGRLDIFLIDERGRPLLLTDRMGVRALCRAPGLSCELRVILHLASATNEAGGGACSAKAGAKALESRSLLGDDDDHFD